MFALWAILLTCSLKDKCLSMVTPAFPHTRANHCSKFQHYQSKTDVYWNSFFPRTVPEWNNLPPMIGETDNLNYFKYKLTNY